MVIPKAKSFPKMVCILHHHGQESTFLPLHKHYLDHHQVLLQVYAYKRSGKLYRTCCCDPLYVVPTRHLHSKTQKIRIIYTIKKIELVLKQPKRMYLMIVYITKDFFAMFCRDYCIKMPCNVQAHDLHFFFFFPKIYS